MRLTKPLLVAVAAGSIALSLGACTGQGAASPTTPAAGSSSPAIAVGEPNPAAPAVYDFTNGYGASGPSVTVELNEKLTEQLAGTELEPIIESITFTPHKMERMGSCGYDVVITPTETGEAKLASMSVPMWEQLISGRQNDRVEPLEAMGDLTTEGDTFTDGADPNRFSVSMACDTSEGLTFVLPTVSSELKGITDSVKTSDVARFRLAGTPDRVDVVGEKIKGFALSSDGEWVYVPVDPAGGIGAVKSLKVEDIPPIALTNGSPEVGD